MYRIKKNFITEQNCLYVLKKKESYSTFFFVILNTNPYSRRAEKKS